MSDPILTEVKKAIDFLNDKTYDEGAFYSHILAIIRDYGHGDKAAEHKKQLERLIFKTDEVREKQRMYWSGHKQVLGECRRLEKELDHKLMNLQTMGYSITQYKNDQAKSQKLF